jgi:hypothetical protein
MQQSSPHAVVFAEQQKKSSLHCPSSQQVDPHGDVPGSQHSPLTSLHCPSGQQPPGNSPQASVPGRHSHPGPVVEHW